MNFNLISIIFKRELINDCFIKYLNKRHDNICIKKYADV